MGKSLRGHTWSNDRGEKREGWQKPMGPPEVMKIMLVSDTQFIFIPVTKARQMTRTKANEDGCMPVPWEGWYSHVTWQWAGRCSPLTGVGG